MEGVEEMHKSLKKMETEVLRGLCFVDLKMLGEVSEFVRMAILFWSLCRHLKADYCMSVRLVNN